MGSNSGGLTNISEMTGATGSGTASSDIWTFNVDIADPSVTVVTGDFDAATTGGVSQGEAPAGYVFSALNTGAYGSLAFNTTDGTFTFTIDRAALYASDSNQTVSFTVTGSDGTNSDGDTVRINLVICVARGTRIRTAAGHVPVEELSVGDKVWTLDGGCQKLAWIGTRRFSGAELQAEPSLRPVRIETGALGRNRPRRPLSVSPQHRVLLRDWRAQMLFGEDEILVPAKSLVNGGTIRTETALDGVEYFHLLFQAHEIIETEGALTESFHPGRHSLRAIDAAARDELFRIFPELEADGEGYGPASRPALKPSDAQALAAYRAAGGLFQ